MKITKDILTFLKNTFLLHDVHEDILEHLSTLCHKAHYKADAVIFNEGNAGDSLFIVASGKVEIWKRYNYPDARLLSNVYAGEYFGEMALVDALPRSATTIAVVDSELYYLNRSDFLDLVLKSPELAMSVMRSLCTIIRKRTDHYVMIMYHRNLELEQSYRKLKETQNELLKNERVFNLGKFSDMILHDIRNPISVLEGQTKVLDTFAADPVRVREIAKNITGTVYRLSMLAEELLDYSRGHVRLNPTVVNLSKIADAVTDYMQDAVSIKGIQLVTVVDKDNPVMVDFHKIIRLLVNLIENSLNACSKGDTIKLHMSSDTKLLTLDVKDTGVGMSPSVLDNVFEPFFSNSEKGTGLGMMIVQSIVEAHHGTLELKSKEGKGTQVMIRIPAKM